MTSEESDFFPMSQVAHLDALTPAIEKFRGEGPIVVNDEKLSDYLSVTRDNALDDGSKLIALAFSLLEEEFLDGWKGFRRIYQFALEREPAESMAPWLTAPMEWWLNESHTPSAQERALVAEDTAILLLRELEFEDNETNPAVAFCLGLVHFRHPERSDERLNKALHWFRTSVEWDLQADKETWPVNQLYVGHCYFALGDVTSALREYEPIDEKELEESGGEEYVESLREKVKSCKTRLNQ